MGIQQMQQLRIYMEAMDVRLWLAKSWPWTFSQQHFRVQALSYRAVANKLTTKLANYQNVSYTNLNGRGYND
jgi:hypothetical protein